ncbi:MAG: CRTAC1 family protein, partial [Haliscomenobacter sp.]
MIAKVRAVKTHVCLMVGAGLLFQVLSSCDSSQQTASDTLFVLHSAEHTGIDFSNDLSYTEQLNPYTFRNFYNGGGVGIGDFNQDGLPDLFFSGNLVPNKLYLNQGEFHFSDITEEAGIGSEGVWTTGVSVVDINGDGLLDIYTCKSGPPGGHNRHNELFINQGNNPKGIPTFSEQAKAFGLDDEGLSTHAAFFDYDRDGDLDLYLLNNSLRSVGGYDLRLNQRNVPDPLGGNKLYRNDGNTFSDVSHQAGIYTSAIGFGLGVTIGDINKDGWQDIYVSNDFFERDYLYINNQNGTFSERLESYMREISMGSMGADMADINNDGLPEVFVTEMLPETDKRLKTTTQFESWDKYQTAVNQGYYHQFSRNALQLNLGKTPSNDWAFAEVSRLAGVQASDWSWGALILDMDNDGLKDIFVANGIYKDLLNQDYVNFIGNPDMVRSILQKKKQVIKELIDSIPSNQVPNYAFHNTDGLHFENKATEWGLGIPSNSNGSAYGDLDNDGDLDLVVNNVNAPAFVYENQSRQQFSDRHFLSVSLKGIGNNRFALGAKVTLYAGQKTFYQELAPMRGFMSSVDYRLLFGLGRDSLLDSIRVEWPNAHSSLLTKVAANQF